MISEKTACVLKVRDFLLKRARSWFEDNGYFEVQTPILTPALGKRAGSFEVKYFDGKAYLSNGFLPYGLILTHKLKKVYTITPSFREEQESTRHLAEHWRIESFKDCSLEDIMKIQEALVKHIFSSIPTETREWLGELGGTPDYSFAKIKMPFHRLTYDQAVDILQRDLCEIFWGEEINPQLEKHLSCRLDRPTFISKYPCSENIFSEKVPENPALSLCADLIAPEGYGEIASSLQMQMNKTYLRELLKDMGIYKRDRDWFLSFIQSSDNAYSGFAMGVERLLQWICKLPDIKEVTAFPRTANSLYP